MHDEDNKYGIKVSDEKQEFKSGAHRDKHTGKGRYDLLSVFALKEVARVYESGAQVYGERNYEKGMNLSRFLDSALRHIFQVIEGKDDENHIANALWNIMGFIQTREMIKRGLLPEDLDDLPDYTPKSEKTLKKSCQHKTVDRDGDCLPCGEDHENIHDGYGFFESEPSNLADGYGSHKTLFGQIVGSPESDKGAFDFDDESVDEKDW